MGPISAENGLAALSQSVFNSLGLSGALNPLGLEPATKSSIILIDGLGQEALAQYSSEFPIFSQFVAESALYSHFPSTTATNLVSLGTGELPGVHGMLGYTVRVPRSGEPGRLLNALKWDERVDPTIWQKVPTLYERAIAEGFSVSHIAEKRYEGSGFTRAGMRGATYLGANYPNDIVEKAIVAHRDDRSFSYIYINNVDKAGHSDGVGSEKWLTALGFVANLLEQLTEKLPKGVQLHFTADHGMINAGEKEILGEGNALLDSVTLIGGEARARHIYIREGAVEERAAAWREHFGQRAAIYTKADAATLFGDVVSQDAYDRMGDLIVVPSEDLVLLDPAIAAREGSMVGHHGGVTPSEVLIPHLSYRT